MESCNEVPKARAAKSDRSGNACGDSGVTLREPRIIIRRGFISVVTEM